MRNRICTASVLAVLTLGASLPQTSAQSIYTPYAFTNFAGKPGSGPGTNDGPSAVARFDGPTGIAVDSAGNVYVADTGNNTIRKVAPTGEVTTLA